MPATKPSFSVVARLTFTPNAYRLAGVALHFIEIGPSVQVTVGSPSDCGVEREYWPAEGACACKLPPLCPSPF
ncbi:hypothetical protein [Comamonas flocculans]|uniref:Uncharacterized protein n=1 Tax=Comamonas flocculans TaxID=2597701 RepID=A0A5B8RXY0_9BURK|nr:hypothetical protein [Comamonas flocculans]QEA13604.1 hypothetical protein FOZ74_11485 [Comamonas flocculans]